MRSRGKAPAATIAALVLAIGLAMGSGGAQAQKSRKAATSDKPASGAIAWSDCANAAPEVASAIDAARHLLGQSWLESGHNFVAAYTMPGETRSPFDLSPRDPGSGPSDGFVEARPPRCTYRASEGTEPAHLVRFVSPFYRFYEADHGWSPPLRNGLMLEAAVTRTATGWNAIAPPSEQSILLPDQKPRRPDPAKLPSDAAWAEPIPGCAKRQKWNGSDCAPRKR